MVKESLTSRAILRFWAPLAGTWMMMALEGPFIAAIIARLPDARENLAAYGVAFAFGLILESPAVMLLSAATVLAENRESYLTLRRFGYGLCGLLTVVVVVVVFPPVFNWLAGSLLNLPTAIRPGCFNYQSLCRRKGSPSFTGILEYGYGRKRFRFR